MVARRELVWHSAWLAALMVLCGVGSAVAADSPLDLDPNGFLRLLDGRQFERLNEGVEAYQSAYEADPGKERQLLLALEVFSSGNPEWDAPMDEWVARYPASYAARVARGIHKVAQGWRWRGTAFRLSTPAVKFDLMAEAFDAAERELVASLELTSKPVVSLQRLISIAMARGDHEGAAAWLDQAVALDPTVYGARSYFVTTLLPRWGGSHEAMRNFADTLDGSSSAKLRDLKGEVEAAILLDQGDQARWAKDYVTAVRHYQQAHALHASFFTHKALGRLYKIIGRDADAKAHLGAALRLDRYDPEVLRMLADLHLRERDYDKAKQYLLAGAAFGDSWCTETLADIALEGKYGQPVDTAMGIRQLERTAYFLGGTALFKLGNMFEKGLGIPTDKEKAFQYYALGAKLGEAGCENNLGLMLWYRNESPEDRQQAALLWKAVADQGGWQGSHNLEFFLSPLERLKLAVTAGPGMWAIWPLSGVAAVVALMLLLAYLVYARRREALFEEYFEELDELDDPKLDDPGREERDL